MLYHRRNSSNQFGLFFCSGRKAIFGASGSGRSSLGPSRRVASRGVQMLLGMVALPQDTF